jgi:hypothetical protein
MHCTHCGTKNDDGAQVCANCGQPLPRPAPPPPAAPPQVPNYLVQAILVTIFCCWPFGIPAIVFAAQVNGKLGAGDVPGAMESSRKAKMWSWISFGCGLGAVALYLLFMAVAIMMEEM